MEPGPARTEEAPAGRREPTLSVVIPVWNEREWIPRCLEALDGALRAADWKAQVVVVDDGSTDGTGEVLAGLAETHGLTVIRQENAGRYAARRAGLAAAVGDYVLLLDSRVLVGASSLAFLRRQLDAHPERRVWNGHVDVVTDGNPYAAFWAGLTKVGWRRYFAAPRLTSFDLSDFDAYPKGTGFFFVERSLLTEATASFSSMYADPRMASDDTRLLRWIAARTPIHIAPEFNCRYHGRDSLAKFVRHATFRGTTFVDGYLGRPGPVRRLAAGAAVVALAAVPVGIRRPGLVVGAGAVGCAAAGAAARGSGATWPESRAVAGLLPLFAGAFAAGAFRGGALALRQRFSR
jgi:Glycosyl transferase family 2